MLDLVLAYLLGLFTIPALTVWVLPYLKGKTKHPGGRPRKKKEEEEE